MSIQTVIAQVLDEALNTEPARPRGYVVRGYLSRPDNAEPGKTYVSVYRTTVTPAADVAAGARRHNLQIVIMSTKTKPGDADNAADAALDDVLDVLDNDPQLAGLVWDEAERGVMGETYPAWTITGWVGTNQEQE